MIPENKPIARSRIIGFAPLDVRAQCGGVNHGLLAVIADKTPHTVRCDLIYLIYIVINDVIVPTLAAAGIDKQIDLVAESRGGHFLKVVRRHAASGLEISTAHIDHQSYCVFSAAEEFRILFTGTGRDRRIESLGCSGVVDPCVHCLTGR